MQKALEFWLSSYHTKSARKSIGSTELIHREANDDFNHVGVLRLDLGRRIAY